MNFGFLFLFLIMQVAVNYGLQIILAPFLAGGSIYAWLAFYLLSSLIIAFVASLINTPKGYRKDFYRHQGFHKMMLSYFLVFFVLDLIFLFL